MPDIFSMRAHSSLHARLAISLLFVLTGGCCAPPKKNPESCWTPRPAVPWSRVVSESAPMPQEGFEIVASQPTVGLFPANMAVTRVAIAEGDEGAGEATLVADPRNEFLQWNRAFDDQMAISEVFPISQRDLGGGAADPSQILAAFRGLHARLGLIYAVNDKSPTESEMFGALYDTENGKPVVLIHAHALSVVTNDDPNKPADPWETDSRALVRKKFEKFAYQAIHTLIVSDQPSRSEPPAGWVPAGPIRPVEWPPRHRVLQP